MAKAQRFHSNMPVKTVKLNQEGCKSELRKLAGEEYLGGCGSLAEFRFKL